MLNLLQSETEKLQEMIVPDSVQKAQLIETVQKITTMDYRQLLTDLVQEGGWILLKVVLALAIYFIGKQLIKWVVRIMDKAFERHNVETSLRSFLRSVVKVLLLLVLILAVVQTLGINTSSFLAIFASAGLAIGMALSGTLQNFAGGVMILAVKPYRVGDYITAQGQSGTVQEIKLFSTVITTVDNQTIYIPNNVIATGIIDNYSTATTRRAEWTLMLTYGDDVEAARKLILGMLTEEKRILPDPAPVVWIAALENNGVRLTVRAWVKNDDLWDVFFEYNERFYNELPKAGLHFALQQHEILVKEDNNLLKNE